MICYFFLSFQSNYLHVKECSTCTGYLYHTRAPVCMCVTERERERESFWKIYVIMFLPLIQNFCIQMKAFPQNNFCPLNKIKVNCCRGTVFYILVTRDLIFAGEFNFSMNILHSRHLFLLFVISISIFTHALANSFITAVYTKDKKNQIVWVGNVHRN